MTWSLAVRRVCQLAILCLLSAGWLEAQPSGGEPERPLVLGAGRGLAFDCGTIDGALLARFGAVKTLCPLALIGGAAFYTDQIRGDNLLVALNREGAMVA